MKKYKIDGWNNFCRVFEVPEEFPKGYCFDGGKPVNFLMKDWFNPVSGLGQPTVDKDTWKKKVGEIPTLELTLEEVEKTIIPFIKKKQYINPNNSYLIIYSFGASTMISPEHN